MTAKKRKKLAKEKAAVGEMSLAYGSINMDKKLARR
jgi:hypothetical protein